ncbi:MAG: hypothetical protein KBS46_07455 [Clostridiales bacterium]|nr:hypothetical protein [Candidatus Apopatocola equi]
MQKLRLSDGGISPPSLCSLLHRPAALILFLPGKKMRGSAPCLGTETDMKKLPSCDVSFLRCFFIRPWEPREPSGNGLLLGALVLALDDEILILGSSHVEIGGQFDGVLGAEVGAESAEGAGGQVEAALVDLFVLILIHKNVLDGAAGADLLAKAALDAAVRMEHDTAAVALKGFLGLERVLLAVALLEHLRDRFLHKGKIKSH